jgi:hypothetical protein
MTKNKQYFKISLTGSRNSSVGMETVTGWKAKIRFPSEAKDVYSPQHLDNLWGNLSFLLDAYRWSFAARIKWLGSEVDHSLHLVFRSRIVELYLHSPTSSLRTSEVVKYRVDCDKAHSYRT